MRFAGLICAIRAIRAILRVPPPQPEYEGEATHSGVTLIKPLALGSRPLQWRASMPPGRAGPRSVAQGKVAAASCEPGERASRLRRRGWGGFTGSDPIGILQI